MKSIINIFNFLLLTILMLSFSSTVYAQYTHVYVDIPQTRTVSMTIEQEGEVEIDNIKYTKSCDITLKRLKEYIAKFTPKNGTIQSVFWNGEDVTALVENKTFTIPENSPFNVDFVIKFKNNLTTPDTIPNTGYYNYNNLIVWVGLFSCLALIFIIFIKHKTKSIN